MKLSIFCIEKPVFATVISLVLILFGVLGLSFLPVRYMPQEFHPHLRIQVDYPGASPELVEQTVTDVLENALSGTSDIQYMSSSSTQGKSQIDMRFNDMSQADFLSIQSQVIREIAEIDNLPLAADKPEIDTNGDSDFIMSYDLYDPNMTQVEISDYMQQNVARALQRVPGVGEVDVESFTSALRIAVDPVKLSALGLSINDVLNALSNNNVSFSVGEMINSNQEIPINAEVLLPNLTAFKNLVIANLGGRLVRVGDVATVTVGPEDTAGSYVTVDGKYGAALGIYAADDANPIAVGKAVRQAMSDMAKYFPPGMKSYAVLDITASLSEAVHEVLQTVIEAVLLVSFVVLLFMGRWKSAIS